MNYIAKYHKKLSNYVANEHIGYYPYKVIANSKVAEITFAKAIKVDVKDATFSFIWKLLDWNDSEKTVKKYLNEENLKKSKFYGKVEMFYIEGSLAEKAFIRENIEKRIRKDYGLEPETDFIVEIDDFLYYPEVKKMSFEDIADLSSVKGAE